MAKRKQQKIDKPRLPNVQEIAEMCENMIVEQINNGAIRFQAEQRGKLRLHMLIDPIVDARIEQYVKNNEALIKREINKRLDELLTPNNIADIIFNRV